MANGNGGSGGGNSSASRLSPVSWFSKFMQMGGIHSSTVEKKKKKMKMKKKNSVPWPVPDSWDGGRFYCGEDDPYFRLSFGGQKSRDPNEKGKFSEMVSDVRRTRISSNVGTNRRYFEVEEDQEMEPKRGSRNIEKDCRNLTALKGQQTRRKPKHGGRVYSPRTECKIKPLEDLKKKKRATKNRKETRAFNKFAVVKNSYDPHGDFRDSMMEMIEEQEIGKPEELEELLACYLTLNSDDYHDLIIKVFRQVWFELNLGLESR